MGYQARVRWKENLGDPAVVGTCQHHLHLDLWMQTEEEHGRRKEAGVVDAQSVHPPVRLGGVLLGTGPGNGGVLPFPSHIARDTAADVLVAGLVIQDAVCAAVLEGIQRDLAEGRVLDKIQNRFEIVRLVMVRVGIDD